MKNVLLSLAAKTSATHKKKKFNGKWYYVCPVVMLKEGVFAANEGPVYYREKELHTFQEAWDNKPVCVGHPENASGECVTATDPDILEKTQIGFLLNTHWDKKLKSYAWIDIQRCKELAPKIIKSIEANTPVEVSTGLVVDLAVKAGIFNDKKYDFIAQAYRPDHLAVLQDRKGACSLADGAGLMVLHDLEGKNPTIADIPKEMREFATVTLDKLLTNQLTHNRLRELLQIQLKPWAKEKGDSYCWIEDVADNFILFSWGTKLWRLGYKKKGDSVVLESKDPVEVERVTQYRMVDGTVIGNQNSTETEGESVMKKGQMVAFLIANAGWEKDDKEVLDGMDEKKLSKLVASHKKAMLANTESEETDDDDDTDNDDVDPGETEVKKKTTKKVVANNEPAAFDMKSWMKAAPREVRMGIRNATRLMNQQIENDVETVVANSDGMFTEEDCRKIDPVRLNKMARVLANKAAAVAKKSKNTSEVDSDDEDDDEDDFDFSGASGFSLSSRMVGNRGKSKEDEEEEKPLGLARPTYEKK